MRIVIGPMQRAALLALLVLWALAGPAIAATVGTETGLPIPRYVTLRAKDVNVRAGPGVRYPI